MKRLAIVLLLGFAVPAGAGMRRDVAEGDIPKYNPLRPPAVILDEVYVEDIDTKTFILVERALLVPDRITLIEGQDVYRIEVVDEQELDRYEPVAQIRLAESLDLGEIERHESRLVRYEQRMWRKGLRLAYREYETAGGVKVRYRAFRVCFEPCGNLYRATVTLYKAKSPLSQQLDTVNKQLAEILSALAALQKEVNSAGKSVSAAVDGVRDAVASLADEVEDLEEEVEDLGEKIQSLEGRIKSLERAK